MTTAPRRYARRLLHAGAERVRERRPGSPRAVAIDDESGAALRGLRSAPAWRQRRPCGGIGRDFNEHPPWGEQGARGARPPFDQFIAFTDAMFARLYHSA